MTDEDILPIDLSAEEGAGAAQRRAVPLLSVAVAVILAVGLAVAVLRVVGGDDRTPAERLTAAPAAAEAAKTATYHITSETDAGAFSSSFVLDGVVDTARSQSTMEIGGRKLEMVTDGTSVYVKVPAEQRGLNQGKAWMKLPAAALTNGAGTAAASPTASPLESFKQLAAAGADIEEVGTEDVRGTSTTHFRTRLDLSKQAAGNPVADQMKNVPVDVWLDGQDRPRRYRFVMSFSVPGQAQRFTVTTTIETYDYGKPVTIETPDPNDVVEADAAALGSLFGGGS